MATYLIGNIKGPKGADGVSPTARVEQTSTGATITITDATGTTSANIRNGVDSDGNNIDLTVYATKTEVAETYASKSYVDAAVEAVDAPVTSVNGMVGAVTITETDPTVPAWAKQPNKPAYTAQEVGALPASTVIPTVPTNISAFANDADYVDASALTTALAGKQDTLIAGPNIDITNGVISASGGSSFSGDYDDLTNKPDLSVYAESADLATVATTGDYDDLTNKPTIPTVPTTVSSFTNDAGYITSSDLPADELPAYTSSDDGKVLSVDNNGDLEWTTPASGGATYTAGDGIDITNDVISNTQWGLPDSTNANAGDVLVLSDRLEAYWDTLSSGGGITEDDIKEGIIVETEPDQETGEYNDVEISGEAGFRFSHYDGTNPDPVSGSWLDSGSVGATETTYGTDDQTGEETVSTNSVSVEPTGIHIQNDDYGVDTNINTDRDGNLTWDGDVILTEGNVNDYVSGGGGSNITTITVSSINTSTWTSEQVQTVVDCFVNGYDVSPCEINLSGVKYRYYNKETMTRWISFVCEYYQDIQSAGKFIPKAISFRINTDLNGIMTYSNNTIMVPSNYVQVDNTTLTNALNAKQDALPALTNNAGKVLTVNSGATGVEWITPSSGGGSSGSGGVKYVDVSQGMIASSFNSNADLLTIGQALADGDDIPIIAIRNGNKTGELWYLINTNRVTGDGGATYTVYCDWYSPVLNEIYHNRYNGSLQQWRDQSPSNAYNYYCTSPTGGSVGDVLAIRSIHSTSGELFFEWKSIKGDSATNAASALYLKDANDAVYEITVGTDGILKATAVSNS